MSDLKNQGPTFSKQEYFGDCPENTTALQELLSHDYTELAQFEKGKVILQMTILSGGK